MTKKLLTKILAVVLCVIMVAPVLTACGPKDNAAFKYRTAGEYTLYDYMTTMPTNWNPHSYTGTTGSDMLSYLTTPFYDYILDPEALEDYREYVAQHGSSTGFAGITMNLGQIIISEAASKFPVDVTSTYKDDYALAGDSGYAWRIYLNPDLKWQNGTAVTATDYVESMKRLLDPDFMNVRADAYTESNRNPLVNARAYLFNGQAGVAPILDCDTGDYTGYVEEGAELYFSWDSPMPQPLQDWFGVTSWKDAYTEYNAKYGFFDIPDGEDTIDIVAKWEEKWEDATVVYDVVNDELELAITEAELDELEADLLALMDMWLFSEEFAAFEMYNDFLPDYGDTFLFYLEVAMGEYGAQYAGRVHEFFLCVDFEYSATWDDVGFKKGSDANGEYLDFIYIFPMTAEEVMLNESGDFLVHTQTYDSLTTTPTGELKTTTYNSNMTNTMSYGPYKITVFQMGTEIVFEKNTAYYAFDPAMANTAAKVDAEDKFAGKTYGQKFEGVYQTDRVYVQIVQNNDAAVLLFDKGLVDTIGLTADIKDKYTGTPEKWRRAPTSGVSNLCVNTDEEALRAITNYGTKNAQVLVIPELREAISLSINRSYYASTFSVASTPSLYALSMLQYIDIGISDAHLYRETKWGKMAIAELYDMKYVGDGTSTAGGSGVFSNLDAAVNAATGYDAARAAELFGIAYDKAIEQGLISAGDEVKLNISVPTGTAQFSNVAQQQFTWLCNSIMTAANNAPAGHKFAKFEIEAHSIEAWEQSYDEYTAGQIELFTGSITGAITTLANNLTSRLDPDNNFNLTYGLDSPNIVATLIGETATAQNTKTLKQWHEILKGLTNAPDKSEDDLDYMAQIGATIELALLRTFTQMPLMQGQSASMYSYKIDSATNIYNVFVGFGGMRYLVHNYDDAEWYQLMKDKNWIITY